MLDFPDFPGLSDQFERLMSDTSPAVAGETLSVPVSNKVANVVMRARAGDGLIFGMGPGPAGRKVGL